MSVQRRPRVPDDLTAEIDKLRGREPFESFVREALYWYVENIGWREKGRLRYATGAERLFNLIASDFWNGDEKDFKRDVDAALLMWQAELDLQAREDEHDETL